MRTDKDKADERRWSKNLLNPPNKAAKPDIETKKKLTKEADG